MKAPKEKRIDLEDHDVSAARKCRARGKAKIGWIANTSIHYHMEIMGKTDEDWRNPTYEKLALRNCEDATRMVNMRASLAMESPVEE
ncbi:hypothetical protein Q3G72_011121 [Acer saccharum]|nr:hypothetical protein Q3G72_011121 [Acer saccharum]